MPSRRRIPLSLPVSIGRRALVAAPFMLADANRPVAAEAALSRTLASCSFAGSIGPGLSGQGGTLRAERVITGSLPSDNLWVIHEEGERRGSTALDDRCVRERPRRHARMVVHPFALGAGQGRGHRAGQAPRGAGQPRASASVGGFGDGLFELRGKQIRLFYVFLPGHVIVLLDGEIKKRDEIPRRTMERMKELQAEVVGRGAARRGRGASG
jgi:hypothetical protein